MNKDSDNKITEHITDWSDAEVVTERIVDDESNMTVVSITTRIKTLQLNITVFYDYYTEV